MFSKLLGEQKSTLIENTKMEGNSEPMQLTSKRELEEGCNSLSIEKRLLALEQKIGNISKEKNDV